MRGNEEYTSVLTNNDGAGIQAYNNDPHEKTECDGQQTARNKSTESKAGRWLCEQNMSMYASMQLEPSPPERTG